MATCRPVTAEGSCGLGVWQGRTYVTAERALGPSPQCASMVTGNCSTIQGGKVTCPRSHGLAIADLGISLALTSEAEPSPLCLSLPDMLGMILRQVYLHWDLPAP